MIKQKKETCNLNTTTNNEKYKLIIKQPNSTIQREDKYWDN